MTSLMCKVEPKSEELYRKFNSNDSDSIYLHILKDVESQFPFF